MNRIRTAIREWKPLAFGATPIELMAESISPSWLPPEVSQAVRSAAPLVLAAATWLSLSPYFVWGSAQWTIYASVVAALVAAACWTVGARLRWRSWEGLGLVLVSLFLVYISLEKRLDGGHTRWIYILPTLVTLMLLSTDQRRRCFSAFAAIFAVSLVPGIVDSLWLAAGFPQTFGEAPVPNTVMAAHGVRFLTSPGALFIESNSTVLPWGGVLFRLTGIYDEPGTVGTNAALLLVALRFRLSDWRVPVLYLAGVLSFSLAFVALASLGLMGYAMLRRRPFMVVAIFPMVVGASMALGWIQISAPNGMQSHIRVAAAPQPIVTTPPASPNQLPTPGATPPSTQPTHSFTPDGTGLRQTKSIDNRSLAPMNLLFNQYLHSGLKTLLLGIASDASVVRGGGSQVWTRVLTDHGFLGFCLLFGGIGLLGLGALRRSLYAQSSFLFLALYSLNIYQRPVVWLPYALLMLTCGPVVAASIAERGARLAAKHQIVSKSEATPRVEVLGVAED